MDGPSGENGKAGKDGQPGPKGPPGDHGPAGKLEEGHNRFVFKSMLKDWPAQLAILDRKDKVLAPGQSE